MKRLSIAEIASKRPDASTLQRDNAKNVPDDLARFLEMPQPAPLAPTPSVEPPTPKSEVETQKRRNVAASKRGSAKVKPDGVLPHDSIYLHPDVRKAIRIHAAESEMRLQDVFRLAVKQYLNRNGIKFRDLETGERESGTAS